jgi:Iap family predicted aminopeptidase
MTDKISQRPVPALDPPVRFAGGEVVVAVRCPVDVSTFPRRHVIVVRHAGERQTFSVHEVAHNHVEWVGGQGHYDLGYAAAIRLMAEKVAGRA